MPPRPPAKLDDERAENAMPVCSGATGAVSWKQHKGVTTL